MSPAGRLQRTGISSGTLRTAIEYERDCLGHFVRSVNTLLKDEDSARDNHVLACIFVRYLLVLKYLPKKFIP